MITVLQIYRKRNSAFFSIEKVFGLIQLSLGRKVNVETVTVPFYSNGLLSVFRNLLFIRKSKKAAVYHITGDIHYCALALPPQKTILTIHDCVFLYSNSGIKRIILKWLFLDMPVKRAKIVTTISEASRGEIIKFSKCDPEKVIVIPNPVNDNIHFSERPFNTQSTFILFIGVTPNKNLDRVILALEGISCTLGILGKPGPEQLELLDAKGINYSIIHNISEQELNALYATSDIVLFPSTFEGFGMPVIEGQKAGRVVITSNLEPMKSVSGKGAYLINPYDVSDIKTAICNVITDADLRESLISAGFENIKRFDVDHIAAAYEQLYSKVAINNV